ncbi:MAG: hypothetical protein RLZ54_567 [Candidatus Parcubacteria bacterium]|jgi:hypothetical protein
MQVERILLIDDGELAQSLIEALISGERASNAYSTYPQVVHNYRDIANSRWSHENENIMSKDLSLGEGDASYQVVGGIKAHQAYDG